MSPTPPPLRKRIADLGQPLYGKVEPTGYPTTSEMWASSAGLLGRMNFATALTAGQIAGVKVDTSALASSDTRRAAAQLLGVEPSPATLAAIQKGSTAHRLRLRCLPACSSRHPISRRGSHAHATLVSSHVRDDDRPRARRPGGCCAQRRRAVRSARSWWRSSSAARRTA